MNLDQAASYLRISRATLDRWIRQGLLADAGLRGAEFDREVLESWARRRGMQTRGAAGARPQTPESLLADSLERGAVCKSTGAKDSKAAIVAGIEALDGLTPTAKAQLIEETLERELLAATALGHGVAIPHPRQPQSDVIHAGRVCVVYLDPPVDWAAIDGLPVHTALLVLSPSTPVHLQLLSRIAFALRTPGFDELLLERPSQAELVEHLRGVHRAS
jgi:PTS system nitrogen regulatory IIA component